MAQDESSKREVLRRSGCNEYEIDVALGKIPVPPETPKSEYNPIPHLQTQSEIEDKCRADLMYWQDAEIARAAHVHCNYCGHNYPHGIFPECPRCRDQIAMAALTGLLSEQKFSADPESRAIIADEVYLFAAAVLEARKRK